MNSKIAQIDSPQFRQHQALQAASCFVPKKISVQRADLARLASTLVWQDDAVTTLEEEIFMREVLATILGKRSPQQFLRQADAGINDHLSHLWRKKNLALADLQKLHSLLAPDAEPGVRRRYALCEGWDASSAVYVPPPPVLLNSYLKDFIKFFNEDNSSLGWLHPLAASVQMILVHPFSDGNGRVARALFWLASRRHGFQRETLEIVDGLWGNGCLLIHAICNCVIRNGWRDPKLQVLVRRVLRNATEV